MREFRPGLAHRTARTAPLRYKLLGCGVSALAYSVFVPVVSLAVDPAGKNIALFVAVSVGGGALAVWLYYVATGMLARRRVLD